MTTAATAFPGANGKIAFHSFRDNSFRADIHVINPDGTGEANLTNLPGSQETTPSWSADGTQIAFASNAGGDEEIWRMAADGTGPVQLTDDLDADRGPTWSPSGASIAFASGSGGDAQIWAMIAGDGSDPFPITDSLGSNAGPAWSPSGAQIAFVSTRDGNREIYTMAPDGLSQVNLTLHPGFDTTPAWSPDGTRIAFASERDGNSEIYVMDADGTDQTRITTNGSFDGDPAWSPDGSMIAFTHGSGTTSDIWVMNADGSGVHAVTSNSYAEADPDWQPTEPEPPDTTDPTITIASPADGASYPLGAAVTADFSCADEAGGSGLATCVGSVADGALLDTSTAGPHSFSVTATDHAGNTASQTHDYTVTVVVSEMGKVEQVRTDLEALLPTGDRHDDSEIALAIKHLGKALGPGVWTDGSHLDANQGKTFFDEAKATIRNLARVRTVDVSAQLAALVGVARQLAQIAIDEIPAVADEPDLAAPGRRGDRPRPTPSSRAVTSRPAQGDRVGAVERYEKAWLRAQTATTAANKP